MKKALLILVLCLIGCSQQEAPLSCDKKFVRDGILSHWKLTCIARFDEILVKDVVANRGNWVCPFRESEPQKFGDEFFVRCIEKKKDDYGNHASCNGEVLELHFETNRGDFTLLWERLRKEGEGRVKPSLFVF